MCAVNTELGLCISVHSEDFVCTVNTFMNAVVLPDSVFAPAGTTGFVPEGTVA